MFIKGVEPISLSFGADGGNWTHNLSLTRRLLYLPWATSAKFNLFNFSALTTRKNKICFYPIIFFISYYNLLNKYPRVTTEKFVKKIFHITLLFLVGGEGLEPPTSGSQSNLKIAVQLFYKSRLFNGALPTELPAHI